VDRTEKARIEAAKHRIAIVGAEVEALLEEVCCGNANLQMWQDLQHARFDLETAVDIFERLSGEIFDLPEDLKFRDTSVPYPTHSLKEF
jgi:hypothetical protein